jgi:4-hydroxy-4-methyl-2-oxoglutarate aldolase
MQRRDLLAASAALGLNPAAVNAAEPAGPLDFKVLLDIRRFDAPTVSNAIETFNFRPRNQGFMRPEIKCVFPEFSPMVGYAVTGKIRANQAPAKGESYTKRSDWWDFIVSIPQPRIIVLEDLDDPPGVGSFWGEVNGSIHRALGCVGAVTNGCVRDLKEVREMGFHFFAQHIAVSHAYVHMVEFGKPVSVGGLTVKPGDLLHGDQHGVQMVPLEIAPKISDAVSKIVASERKTIDYCHSPGFTLEGLKKLTGG